jgi:hypothetical protein
MNGRWTHYVCTAQEKDKTKKTPLEKFLLYERPMALATRERFKI